MIYFVDSRIRVIVTSNRVIERVVDERVVKLFLARDINSLFRLSSSRLTFTASANVPRER